MIVFTSMQRSGEGEGAAKQEEPKPAQISLCPHTLLIFSYFLWHPSKDFVVPQGALQFWLRITGINSPEFRKTALCHVIIKAKHSCSWHSYFCLSKVNAKYFPSSLVAFHTNLALRRITSQDERQWTVSEVRNNF